MKRKLAPVFLLVVCVVCAVIILPAKAEAISFNDTSGHWAEVPIDRWTDYGVLTGYSGVSFKPNNYITRAEFFTIVAKVMNYSKTADNPFSDIDKTDWYYDYIIKLVGAGIVNGSGGKINPNDFITREQAMATFARIFKVPVYADGLNVFPDANLVSFWARGEVGGLVRAGYVHGADGYLKPGANITRGEAVKLVDNIITGYFYEGDVYSRSITGVAVVNTSGVELRDMAILGDLHITQGVGDGVCVLDNVIVNGDIYISGGGPDSIKLRGNTRANNVYVGVDTSTGPVRLSVASPAEAGVIHVLEGSDTVIIDGIVDRVEVGTDAKAVADNATVKEIYMSGEFGQLRVNENSRVSNLYCTTARTSVYVSGAVDRTVIYSSAPGVSFDTGKTAVVTEVESWANDTLLSGIGRLSFAYIKSGQNVRVTVPEAIVQVSADAGVVITGDGPNDTIQPGETGQVGSSGTENALNVKSVTITSATRIAVEFTKAPDTVRGTAIRSYVLSGDAVSMTSNRKTYPDFVEISGNIAYLTFTDATFTALSPGQTAIITVSGFTATDGSPIGISSGLYRVPSNDAVLRAGTLSGQAITGSWEGANTIGDGGLALSATIPIRLASDAALEFTRSESNSTVKIYKVGSTGIAPTADSQFTQANLTGLTINDGDKIYIQVTAANGVTKVYYKLTVTVISTPILESITYPNNDQYTVRFNLAQLDEETHIRFGEYDDDNNQSTYWRQLRKTSSDGTGYVELDLRNTADRALITVLKEGYYLYTGKNVGGTIEERKRLDEIGAALTTTWSRLYYTTSNNTLIVNGLSPDTAYIAVITKGSTDTGTAMRATASATGALSLGTASGVTDVQLQKVQGRRIEQPVTLGTPITASVTVDLRLGKISGTFVGNQYLRIGDLQLTGTGTGDLLDSSGNLTAEGLAEITRMDAGAYDLVAEVYTTAGVKDSEVIPTWIASITISAAPAVSAKFIAADKILFSGASSLTGSNTFVIAENGVSKNTSVNKTLTVLSGRAKAELSMGTGSNVTAVYNDEIVRSAYLVTAYTISKPVSVSPWVYVPYQFTSGINYTVSSSASYTTTNYVNPSTSEFTFNSTTYPLICVDGEYYLEPIRNNSASGTVNKTLMNVIKSLNSGDVFTATSTGLLSGITSSGASIEIDNPLDCNQTSLTVSGGATTSRLTLTSPSASSQYTGTVIVARGAINISGFNYSKAQVSSTGAGANLQVSATLPVDVSAAGITIQPYGAGAQLSQSGVITVVGSGSSAILHGVTVSGDSATAQSDASATITISGSAQPSVNIPASATATGIVLSSTARNAVVTTSQSIPVSVSALPSGARPTFNLNAGNEITFTLVNSTTATITDANGNPVTGSNEIPANGTLTITGGTHTYAFKILNSSATYTLTTNGITQVTMTGSTQINLNVT